MCVPLSGPNLFEVPTLMHTLLPEARDKIVTSGKFLIHLIVLVVIEQSSYQPKQFAPVDCL